MNEILLRRLCLRVAKSYDEDFDCDISVKSYHLSKTRQHFMSNPNRFDGLKGKQLNEEITKFLTEVQSIVELGNFKWES